jgi:hypothetical protein
VFLRLVLFALTASVVVGAEEQSNLQDSLNQDSLNRRFTDLFRFSMTPRGYRAEEPKERLRTEDRNMVCNIFLNEVRIPKDKHYGMQQVKPSVVRRCTIPSVTCPRCLSVVTLVIY